MKFTKIFLTMQYLCLAGTTAIPLIIASIISQEVKITMPALAKVLLLSLISVLLIAALAIEIICTHKASACIKNGENEKAFGTLRQLKLVSIPFYVINFIIYIVSAPVCFPLSIITVPLDFVFCWIMIIISGVLGIRIVKKLRNESNKINPVHFVLQVLPVADVISTVILRKKIKQ